MKSILITGCSTGIGWTCALGMKARGWRVFATARKPEDLQRLTAAGLEAFYLDYRDSASIAACVAEIATRTNGKLDALFNNGAYGQPGAVEDLSRKVLEEQFSANFFGWHELTIACLPLMRANGFGRIVQNSSVLGIVAMKWRGAYNASKFAIEGLTDTLRLELRGSGIAVSTIEPGPITSQFVPNAKAAFDQNIAQETSHYRESYVKQTARLGKGGSNRFKLPPDAVLEKLIHAVENPRPKAHYYVTTPTKLMGLARRFLPDTALDWFVNRMSDQ